MPDVEKGEVIRCRNCNSLVPKSRFCIVCGVELDNYRTKAEITDTDRTPSETIAQLERRRSDTNTSKRVCPSCKRQTPGKYPFCIYCGLKIDEIAVSTSITGEKSRFCSECGKYYGKDLNFCLICGKPLAHTPQIVKKQHIKPVPEFKGFTIPLLSPINSGFVSKRENAVLPATTSIMRVTPKDTRSIFLSGTPVRSKGVKSQLFTVPIPGYLTKSDSLKSSLSINTKHYLFTWMFVYVIYVFWFFFFYDSDFIKSIFSLDILSNITAERLIAVFIYAIPNSFFVSMILLLPAITLSHKVFFKHEITVIYRIEPAVMILTFFTNLIVTALRLFFPLIMLPGDIKMKELPPEKEIGAGLSTGVTICVILTSILGLVVFSIIRIPVSSSTAGSTIFIESIQMTFIMCSWICIITLLPIGNVLGKMIQKKDTKRFILLLSVSVLLIIYSVRLSDVYR
ncbi:MAG: zinc ribbon domain-containing protein [Candidatus Hodarchaeales archaeon]